MTLKEKFLPFVDYIDLINDNPDKEECGLRNTSKCIEIADDFAIGFALWKEAQVTQDDNGDYYGESRIGVSRNNPVTILQLLEIYKNEKGL
jgi:hypothetical protein